VFFNVKFYTSALVGMIKVIHAHSASFMEPYKYDAEGYNFF
jgi:L-arabinose isomerase